MKVLMINDIMSKTTPRDMALNLGPNLQRLRLHKGVDLETAAKGADLNKNTMSDLENNKFSGMPRPSTLQKLAKYYGLEVEDLFAAPKDKKPDVKIQQPEELPKASVPSQDTLVTYLNERLDKALRELGAKDELIKQLLIQIEELKRR